MPFEYRLRYIHEPMLPQTFQQHCCPMHLQVGGPPLDLCERQQSSLGPSAPGALQATGGGAEASGSQQKVPEDVEDGESNEVGPGKSLLRREDLVSSRSQQPWKQTRFIAIVKGVFFLFHNQICEREGFSRLCHEATTFKFDLSLL